jgi:hypothetical protein
MRVFLFVLTRSFVVPEARCAGSRNGPLKRTNKAIRSSVFALLLFLLCAPLGVTQEPAPKSTGNSTPEQTRLEGLLDRLASLPPEYKADLGFTVLDAAATALSPAQKRSLLDDIFHSSTRSHYLFSLTDASSQNHNDLVAGLLANSRLDALDIQSQAVERALPLAPQFAGQLFEEMRLGEDRASCTDADVENVSAFYTTAEKIFENQRITAVFGEKKGFYLLTLVTNMKIPAEIAPLAGLIARVPLTNDQLSQIEGAFDSALNKITASDREMTAAEEDGNLTRAINQLSLRFAQSGVYSGRLLAAYRSFLVRSLTPESCSDRSLDRAIVAGSFNTLLPDLPRSSPDLTPLTAVQLQPASTGAAAQMHNASINQQMTTKLYRIAAANAARSTDEFSSDHPSIIAPQSSDMDDVINYATSTQTNTSECAVCDFEAKGALLSALIQLLPPGSDLEKAVYAQMDYLSFNDMQKDDPVAWLHLFKGLLNDSRKIDKQTRDSLTTLAKRRTLMPLDSPSAAAPEISRMLRESTDPIFSAYLSAGDLLHLPFLMGEPY